MSLIQRCLASTTEPDQFATTFLAPLIKKKLRDTQDESEKQRKEQEQEVIALGSMVTVSRRFILLTFVCKMLSEVLGVPFDELAPATSLLAPLKATVRCRCALTYQLSWKSFLTLLSVQESENVRGMLFKETPDLRLCSNPDCTNQEAKEKTFLVCSPCRKAELSVPYCSRDCQAKDWPEHKKTCGVAPTVPVGRNRGSGAKIEELPEEANTPTGQ